MGIRETLNKNPKATTGATIGLTVLALLVIIWQMMPSAPEGPPDKAYFTTDDGATFFAESLYKIPPFKHQGKEAVRAHVYQIGDKGKPEVVWLEKFSDEIKAQIEKHYAKEENQGKYMPEFYDDMFKLVKRKGPGPWMPGNPMMLQAFRLYETKDGVGHEVYPE